MPPTQPGSRAGLITGLVISVILCVVFISLTFYFKLEGDKAAQDKKDALERQTPIASDLDLARPDVKELLAEAKKQGNMRLVDFLIQQKKDMARPLTGNVDDTPLKAKDKVDAALAGARAKVKKNFPDALTDALGVAADAAVEEAAARKVAEDELVKLTAAKNTLVEQHQTELAEKQKAVDVAAAQVRKAEADMVTMRELMTGDNKKVFERAAEEAKTNQDNQQKLLTEVQARDAKIVDLNKQIERLKIFLTRGRGSVEDPIVRQTDGHILQIGGQNVVYIDLGKADHVVPGLTFEVYDKDDGVPKLGDALTEENLPAGKASIEVIRIDALSCECRVTRVATGKQVSVGDVIANLIYDRNVKPLFFVFGDFDTDRNGTYTPQEAEVVKRLINMWGGAVTLKLDMDVDFVIMGKEPVLPKFTAEELQDVVNLQKLEQARVALESYEKIRQDSRDLHIPMMNQNRFLYFIGYFDRLKNETGH